MDMGQENSGRGPTYRAALIAVIILSGLFVAGVVALVIGFVRQYQIYQAGSHSSANLGTGAPPRWSSWSRARISFRSRPCPTG